MRATDNQLLTAGDLMSRDIQTVCADMPLRDAAARLIRREVHGAPVVDDEGRCVGVLSVTDLVRWASGHGQPRPRLPRTCASQETCREPGGRETVLCRLAEGGCSLQHLQEMSDGCLRLACAEPNSVPVDWQVVGSDSGPGDVVRDFMTTTVVTVDPAAPVHELARLMLEHRIHRLIVLDGQRHPLGVVAIDDLMQVLAHPEIVNLGDSL